MKKAFIVCIAVFILLFCNKKEKSNVFIAEDENIYFSLELPCKDEMVKEMRNFIQQLQKRIGNKFNPISNITFGKLTIKNKSKLYLNADKSSIKVVCNLKGDGKKEGIPIDKIFDLVRYEANSLNHNVIFYYENGKNEFTYNDFEKRFILKIVNNSELIKLRLMELKEDWIKVSKEGINPFLIIILKVEKKGEKKHREYDEYRLEIIKKDGGTIQLVNLVEELKNFQREIAKNMEAYKRDIKLYNKNVEIYNKAAELIRDIILLQEENEYNFYYLEGIKGEEIKELIIKGGDYNEVGSELLNKMRKNDNMPLLPDSQFQTYYGFKDLDRNKMENAYIHIGAYKKELK